MDCQFGSQHIIVVADDVDSSILFGDIWSVTDCYRSMSLVDLKSIITFAFSGGVICYLLLGQIFHVGFEKQNCFTQLQIANINPFLYRDTFHAYVFCFFVFHIENHPKSRTPLSASFSQSCAPQLPMK